MALTFLVMVIAFSVKVYGTGFLRSLFPPLPQLLLCCPLPAKHYNRKAWPIVKHTWQSNVRPTPSKAFHLRCQSPARTLRQLHIRHSKSPSARLHYILRFLLFTFTLTLTSSFGLRTTCTNAERVTLTTETLVFGHHHHYSYRLCSQTITLAPHLQLPTPLATAGTRSMISQSTP